MLKKPFAEMLFFGFAILVLAGIRPLHAQTADGGLQGPYVFSSGGGLAEFSLAGSPCSCAWNIGEPITEEFGSRAGFDASKKRLTQGFEQGEGYVEDPFTAGLEDREKSFSFSLYPNPTRGKMQGRLAGRQDRAFILELRSMSGFLLWKERRFPGDLELDLEAFPAGAYVLSVTEQATGDFSLCKIIKVL